jgi:hypothetical protein
LKKYLEPLQIGSLILFLLGIFLQLQLTIGRSETYLGLRLCLADALLPLIGAVAAVSLLRGKSQWPMWRTQHIDLWMGGITALMVLSFFWGWYQMGELSQWALVNRVIGWGVLLGYFYGAAWLATNLPYESVLWFIRSFISFCLIVASIYITAIILSDFGWVQTIHLLPYPAEGLSGNRNAFALMYLATLCFALTNPQIEPFKKYWAIFLIPLMVSYNGSRMMLIALIFILAYALYLKTLRQDWKTWISLALGILILVGIHSKIDRDIFREHQDQRLFEFIVPPQQQPEFSQQSDQIRSILYREAIDTWQRHPIFGIGLGANLAAQQHEQGHLIDLIDSVPLWLICEMGVIGVIGLAAFLGFSWVVMRVIWIGAHKTKPQSEFYHSMLLFILCFVLMASVHQLLYTRFLWVLLGFSMALPRLAHQK